MSQKKFFSIAAIIFISMIAFFTIQLISMQLETCRFELTWECDIEAQVGCEGGDYETKLMYSACIQEDCVGSFSLTCLDTGQRENNLNCKDEWHIECQGGM